MTFEPSSSRMKIEDMADWASNRAHLVLEEPVAKVTDQEIDVPEDVVPIPEGAIEYGEYSEIVVEEKDTFITDSSMMVESAYITPECHYESTPSK